MKNFHSYLLILCCTLPLTACAQTKPLQPGADVVDASLSDTFQLEKLIPGQYSYMDVDVLNNLYLISGGNQLKKLNERGDSVAVFDNVKKYGNPSSVDVSNPLKLLLYYKNFATVVILDRFLSQRNSINFRSQNIFSVSAIATSYDNNIWLFDEQNFKLVKMDDDGKKLQESSDWRQIMNDVPLPRLIIDHNNFVYLYDPEKGFYIFDYYGTFKNTLPFLGWENVSVSGGAILGFAKNKFYRYTLQSLSLQSYTLPASFKDYLGIKAMNGRVYLHTKNGIEIYRVR